MKSNARELAIITSPDGSERFRLMARPDGFFLYEREIFAEDVYNLDYYGKGRNVARYEYWRLEHTSGLFDTVEAARADAAVMIDWLGGLGPS